MMMMMMMTSQCSHTSPGLSACCAVLRRLRIICRSILRSVLMQSLVSSVVLSRLCHGNKHCPAYRSIYSSGRSDEVGRQAGVRCVKVRPRHSATAPTSLAKSPGVDQVQARTNVCTAQHRRTQLTNCISRSTPRPDSVFALPRRRL